MIVNVTSGGQHNRKVTFNLGNFRFGTSRQLAFLRLIALISRMNGILTARLSHVSTSIRRRFNAIDHNRTRNVINLGNKKSLAIDEYRRFAVNKLGNGTIPRYATNGNFVLRVNRQRCDTIRTNERRNVLYYINHQNKYYDHHQNLEYVFRVVFRLYLSSNRLKTMCRLRAVTLTSRTKNAKNLRRVLPSRHDILSNTTRTNNATIRIKRVDNATRAFRSRNTSQVVPYNNNTTKDNTTNIRIHANMRLSFLNVVTTQNLMIGLKSRGTRGSMMRCGMRHTSRSRPRPINLNITLRRARRRRISRATKRNRTRTRVRGIRRRRKRANRRTIRHMRKRDRGSGNGFRQLNSTNRRDNRNYKGRRTTYGLFLFQLNTLMRHRHHTKRARRRGKRLANRRANDTSQRRHNELKNRLNGRSILYTNRNSTVSSNNTTRDNLPRQRVRRVVRSGKSRHALGRTMGGNAYMTKDRRRYARHNGATLRRQPSVRRNGTSRRVRSKTSSKRGTYTTGRNRRLQRLSLVRLIIRHHRTRASRSTTRRARLRNNSTRRNNNKINERHFCTTYHVSRNLGNHIRGSVNRYAKRNNRLFFLTNRTSNRTRNRRRHRVIRRNTTNLTRCIRGNMSRNAKISSTIRTVNHRRNFINRQTTSARRRTHGERRYGKRRGTTSRTLRRTGSLIFRLRFSFSRIHVRRVCPREGSLYEVGNRTEGLASPSRSISSKSWKAPIPRPGTPYTEYYKRAPRYDEHVYDIHYGYKQSKHKALHHKCHFPIPIFLRVHITRGGTGTLWDN